MHFGSSTVETPAIFKNKLGKFNTKSCTCEILRDLIIRRPRLYWIASQTTFHDSVPRAASVVYSKLLSSSWLWPGKSNITFKWHYSNVSKIYLIRIVTTIYFICVIQWLSVIMCVKTFVCANISRCCLSVASAYLSYTVEWRKLYCALFSISLSVVIRNWLPVFEYD